MPQTRLTARLRRRVKRACRARVWDGIGRCMGVQLLYAAPYALLLALLYAGLFGRALALAAAGQAAPDMGAHALAQGMNTVWLVMFLMLVVGGPLQYGLMRFYICLCRGEPAGAGMLLQPFASLQALWTGIKMSFSLFFRALLWTAIPAMLYMTAIVCVVFGALRYGQTEADGLIMGISALYTLAMTLTGVRLLYYHAGWVELHDHPECGVWEAAARASRVFRGQFGRLLLFVLSFAGWYILLAGVSGGCLGLGLLGWELLAGPLGTAVLAAALLAAVCLYLVLGSFTAAYTATAFIGVYDALSAPGDETPADGTECI